MNVNESDFLIGNGVVIVGEIYLLSPVEIRSMVQLPAIIFLLKLTESLLRKSLSRFGSASFLVEPFTVSLKFGNSLTGIIGFTSLTASDFVDFTASKSDFMFGFGGLAFGIIGVI